MFKKETKPVNSFHEKQERARRERRKKIIIFGLIGMTAIPPIYMLGSTLYSHFNKPETPVVQQTSGNIESAMLNRYVDEKPKESTTATSETQTETTTRVNSDSRVSALERELEAVRAEKAVATSEAERAKLDLEAFKKENQKLVSENTTVRAELASSQARIQTLSEEITALQNQLRNQNRLTLPRPTQQNTESSTTNSNGN